MIVYNISLSVDQRLLEAWTEWITASYIPEIMQTGFFDDHKMYRLLELPPDQDPTFVIQFSTSALSRYNGYIEQRSEKMHAMARKHWGEQYLHYDTCMQFVQ